MADEWWKEESKGPRTSSGDRFSSIVEKQREQNSGKLKPAQKHLEEINKNTGETNKTVKKQIEEDKKSKEEEKRENNRSDKKENEKKTQKSLEMRSSLGEDFVANADERLYDEDVRRDVSRRIAAGQITDLSTALTSAQNQTEEKNKQSYYSNLGNYDKRLFALVARGEFEAADKLFAALNPPEEKVEAEKTMEKFYTGGGILTDKNRKAIFKAVSAAADNDLEAAISTMNSLETQSLRARADAFKGPKQKITYIPKGNEFSLQTGAVDTKTIDAPIDPATGEIDKAWLDDFIEYSAQRIIGMDELTPADRNTVNGTGDQTTSGTSGSSGDTPRSLFTNYPSTAQN